ncbi:MAG: tyrosine--tRNA ligase [Anaerolineaceae bacterium]|nr:tyrosine--tRNA ligase [Anaerolineaceae bacterium]MDD4042960.1 tyrosine--tRNA ligase [Anaerolineaceae bacterium]MDD4578091.1 tyrosine--tRNA ligase [Anaerolineaceae bacterium]
MWTIDEQVEYLMQGADFGDASIAETMAVELRERLVESEKTGRPLRVYCGYDPTSTDLHLGHTVTMRKLRQFQELGHHVLFVIGSFTAMIGDPSDKDKLRKQLTHEQVMENGRTYAEQAFRILDPEKTEVVYNHEWLEKITFTELIDLASNFTVQQFLARDNFHKRFEKSEPIYLHEFFYALMQGYDAYHLDADVQIGGSDQLFNIITAARKLMTFLGKRPNIGIVLGILPGTDGEIRMSKSLGNHIPLNTSAEDMYGKVMSIPDKAMPVYARLATEWTPEKLHAFETGLSSNSLHPRDAKMKLAFGITTVFYGEEAARNAQEQFVSTFQKGNIPDEMPEYQVMEGDNLIDVMVSQKMASSRGEARRLIDQQGVKLDGEAVNDMDTELKAGQVLQVGKRRFLRLR